MIYTYYFCKPLFFKYLKTCLTIIGKIPININVTINVGDIISDNDLISDN